MKKKMIGIGAVAILTAIMLIGTSDAGTSDAFAKTRHNGPEKKYGQSDAQDVRINVECPADIQNEINQELTTTGGSGGATTGSASGSIEGPMTSSTDCAASSLMNQGDGAALIDTNP